MRTVEVDDIRMKWLRFRACYYRSVDFVRIPPSPSFAATLVAVGALALALTTVPPSITRLRTVKKRLLETRTACVSVLGEIRVLEQAVADARAAVDAVDIKGEAPLASIYRCRRALRAFQSAAQGASDALAKAAQSIEDREDIAQTMNLTQRGWDDQRHAALEKVNSLREELARMFDLSGIEKYCLDVDALYSQAVAVEVEQAILISEGLSREAEASPDEVIAALKGMLDFCEAHGIDTPQSEPA